MKVYIAKSNGLKQGEVDYYLPKLFDPYVEQYLTAPNQLSAADLLIVVLSYEGKMFSTTHYPMIGPGIYKRIEDFGCWYKVYVTYDGVYYARLARFPKYNEYSAHWSEYATCFINKWSNTEMKKLLIEWKEKN